MQAKRKNAKKNKKIWKLPRWNIRILNGKEWELVYEFHKEKLDILGVTEKKKILHKNDIY